MKKLMIVAAVALAAVASNAASLSWSLSMGQSFYQAGSTTQKLTGGTAYFFDALLTGTSQEDIFKAFNSTTGIDFSKAIGQGSVTGTGGMTANPTTSGFVQDAAASYYVVLVDNGNLLITDLKPVTNPNGDKDQPVQFAVKTASQKALDKTGKFSGTGWYAQTVPEPTSGLLLLLGVAGLALRRRRA